MDPRASGALTALIADDELPARRRIAELLGRRKDVRVLGQCATGPATLEAVRALSPDVVFLDVQMPGLSGFEVLAALRPEERPVVVFSTAYDEYALAAFEVHAVDYLLKPYADERFDEALQRAEMALRTARLHEWRDRLRGLLEEVGEGAEGRQGGGAAGPGDRLDRFAVRRGDRLALIDAADVDWLEAARDYVRLHVGRDVHVVRITMAELERRLDPDRFLRIHRSTIVQLRRIRELYPDLHGDYIAALESGGRLRVSRRYRDTALARLGVRH